MAVGSLAPAPRQAAAGVGITSPEGILCFELTGLATGIGLVRIDHDTATDEVTFTSQVYIQDTDPVPSCQSPQDPMPDDATAFPERLAARPSLPGMWNDGTDTLTATLCQADLEFGPLMFDFAEVTVNFVLLAPPAKATGTFSLQGPFTDDQCTQGDPAPLPPVDVVGAIFLDGPDADPSTFDSDVDKDGFRDWDELAANLPACSDPFSDANCSSVGGIAELPAVAGTALEAGSSGSDAGMIAAAAAATAAGALALGSVTWYARRRIR